MTAVENWVPAADGAADPRALPGSQVRCRGKRAVDLTGAVLALTLTAPLLVLLALLVRCTSRGPALYRQVRIGERGRPFTLYKFRSMVAGAHEERPMLFDLDDHRGGVLFKIRRDPRVTPLGRVLRRWSLDELPQLVNVLLGHMSLVGPRPPLPDEVTRYEPRVHRRLAMRPGLTGLWQVSGRSDLSWEESVRLDLYYVNNWTIGLDLRILLRTVGAVVSARGAY